MLGKLRAESWSGVSPGKGRESGEEEDGPAVRQSAGILLRLILGGLGIPQSFRSHALPLPGSTGLGAQVGDANEAE